MWTTIFKKNIQKYFVIHEQSAVKNSFSTYVCTPSLRYVYDIRKYLWISEILKYHMEKFFRGISLDFSKIQVTHGIAFHILKHLHLKWKVLIQKYLSFIKRSYSICSYNLKVWWPRVHPFLIPLRPISKNFLTIKDITKQSFRQIGSNMYKIRAIQNWYIQWIPIKRI